MHRVGPSVSEILQPQIHSTADRKHICPEHAHFFLAIIFQTVQRGNCMQHWHYARHCKSSRAGLGYMKYWAILYKGPGSPQILVSRRAQNQSSQYTEGWCVASWLTKAHQCHGGIPVPIPTHWSPQLRKLRLEGHAAFPGAELVSSRCPNSRPPSSLLRLWWLCYCNQTKQIWFTVFSHFHKWA